MGACTAQLTEVGSKRQDAPAQGSRFGIGPHSSLSGTLEDILRNGKAKVGKLVEGCHSVRSFPQDTLGLAKSVAGFFLETVSFVDSVFLIARNNLIFFVVGSDCQGFPFEVVSKELDDAFVGLDLDTSFANLTARIMCWISVVIFYDDTIVCFGFVANPFLFYQCFW